MRALWRLRTFAGGLWWVVTLALVCMVITALSNMAVVAKTQPVFTDLFTRLGVATTAEAPAMLHAITHKALILVMVVILSAVANAGSLLLGEYIGQKVLVRLREKLFAHLQGLSLAFFERRRTGELISRVNNDTSVLQRALGTDLFKIVVGPLTVLFMAVQMLLISWRLTVAIGVVIPIAIAFTTATGYYVRRYGRRTQAKIADLTAVTEESFAAMRVVKTFGLEPQSQERFDHEVHGVFRTEMKAAVAKAIGMPPVMAIVGAATALTLVLGGYEILQHRLVAANLVVLLLYLELAGTQMNTVSRLYLMLQHAEASAERTLALLQETADVQDAPEAVDLPSVEGGITFDHVDFAYDVEHPVLRDFCLDIKPGEVVALAGPSGSGKTTVANLVPRLYDVQQGSVRIDDVDVRQVRQASLKRFMGIVPQETILFGTTIGENIRYGRPEASEAEIVAAAQAANAHDFIMSLPDRYETLVGERGVLLSGGQRQRVAIARAFLRDPRILILDEATSSLDNESEAAIHVALASLLRGRTALIIAHRLSTIRDADRIVVMSQGSIAEQGTHDELMQHDGLYRRLYESKEMADDAAQPSPARQPECDSDAGGDESGEGASADPAAGSFVS